MKLSKREQQSYFEEGYILVGEDGIAKKIMEGDFLRGIEPCLGFRNLDGNWFYGAGYFPEDEELTVE